MRGLIKKALTVVLLTGLIGLSWWAIKREQAAKREKWTGEKHEIGIVAIKTEAENLWDPEMGIYVKGNHDNYLQSGANWERSAEMKFYEPDGSLGFEKKIGLRMHGQNRSMPQRAWRVYFKDVEGRNGILNYPLFGREGSQKFSSLALRVGDSQLTMIRDWLARELVSRVSELDTQRSRPVAVYLNGEYWGLYFLQERFDENYFLEKYQIPSRYLGLIEVPLSSGDDKGQAVADSKKDEEEAERYNQLLKDVRWCQGCVGYETINKQVEADNLIDYLLFELYFANIDWPYNNTKVWRYKRDPLTASERDKEGVMDGRFRWLFFDLDVGFGGATESKERMEIMIEDDAYGALIDDAFPFGNLFYDVTFQRKYLRRLKELLAKDLKAEKMEEMIDRLAGEIRPEMPRQIERWEGEVSEDGYKVAGSMEEWEERLELLKEFVRLRPEKFLEQTKSFLQRSKA